MEDIFKHYIMPKYYRIKFINEWFSYNFGFCKNKKIYEWWNKIYIKYYDNNMVDSKIDSDRQLNYLFKKKIIKYIK